MQEAESGQPPKALRGPPVTAFSGTVGVWAEVTRVWLSLSSELVREGGLRSGSGSLNLSRSIHLPLQPRYNVRQLHSA